MMTALEREIERGREREREREEKILDQEEFDQFVRRESEVVQ